MASASEPEFYMVDQQNKNSTSPTLASKISFLIYVVYFFIKVIALISQWNLQLPDIFIVYIISDEWMAKVYT